MRLSNYTYGYLYMILRDHDSTQMLVSDQVFKIETIHKSGCSTKPPYGIIRRDRFDYNARKPEWLITKITRGNECISLEFNGVIERVIEQKYIIGSTNSTKDMITDRPIYHILDDIISDGLLNDFLDEITGRAPNILDGLDDEDLDNIPNEAIRNY